MDLVISGGTIIDGTKKQRFAADLGIQKGRIAAIGDLRSIEGIKRIDAKGKIVAPGFVDLHNHSDGWLLKNSHLWPKTSQGFTTEVLMADGISYAPVTKANAREWIHYLRALNAIRLDEYTGWETMEDYAGLLEGNNVQNFALHVPYGNVRAIAGGWTSGPVDDFQWRIVETEIRRGMELGAVGLSTGLDYLGQLHATTDELVNACRVVAEYGGLYVTHIRYKRGLMPAVREAVEIGKRSGVKVHISHLKGATPQITEELLNYIDTTARHECDFSFDIYPYLPGSTMLNFLLPYDVWDEGPMGVVGRMTREETVDRFGRALAAFPVPLERIHIAWSSGKEATASQGMLLSDYVDEVGLPAAEALCNLLWEDHLSTLLVLRDGDDPVVYPMLRHDLFLLGTDGIYHPDGVVHPRVYGSTGRILGPCVRDHKLFTLEEAVHKMSGASAARFGFPDRGVLRIDAAADIVVFDAETIGDHATFDDPHQVCSGIEQVIVGGVPIVVDGEPAAIDEHPLPGRFVRRG